MLVLLILSYILVFLYIHNLKGGSPYAAFVKENELYVLDRGNKSSGLEFEFDSQEIIWVLDKDSLKLKRQIPKTSPDFELLKKQYQLTSQETMYTIKTGNVYENEKGLSTLVNNKIYKIEEIRNPLTGAVTENGYFNIYDLNMNKLKEYKFNTEQLWSFSPQDPIVDLINNRVYFLAKSKSKCHYLVYSLDPFEKLSEVFADKSGENKITRSVCDADRSYFDGKTIYSVYNESEYDLKAIMYSFDTQAFSQNVVTLNLENADTDEFTILEDKMFVFDSGTIFVLPKDFTSKEINYNSEIKLPPSVGGRILATMMAGLIIILVFIPIFVLFYGILFFPILLVAILLVPLFWALTAFVIRSMYYKARRRPTYL